jgi:hypothetical protein
VKRIVAPSRPIATNKLFELLLVFVLTSQLSCHIGSRRDEDKD